MHALRGLGFTIFGAALLYLLWIGANNHYTAVADFKAAHLEPNSGEVPKVHEKRKAPSPLSTGATVSGSTPDATLPQTLTSMSGSISSIPIVSASTTAGTVASLASAVSSATASDNGGALSESDGAQFALALGIIGVVLVF